ncbi:MAG: acyl-ACP--UDP-N-acetylglucosamine O-acyltransferase [Oligoflexia bacterium]|nr:acyl-ACP--UDP-N-acetylglucosamine O-acyltransferase [Oligoflexia bacterium]
MSIHPSAYVHPKAELDSSVEVGPFAYVGEYVRIGKNSIVEHHASIEGHTTIGEANEIGSYSCIGGKPQDLKYKNEPTKLVIGNNNKFRECVTVNLGTVTGGGVTKIGDHCLVMAYCHVAHDCEIGNHVIMANYTGLSGHVVLEDWAILSGMCGITQFLRVGKHAFIGGMTGIRKDVAPYVTLVGDPSKVRGLNLVGLKRRGFDGDRLRAVMDTYKIYFESGLEKEQALQEIESRYADQNDVRYFVDFIKNSKNGISR